jgi:hypothetical protein
MFQQDRNMTHLDPEIESVVLAMWGEPEEEITLEVMNRFSISYEHAVETVHACIQAELAFEDDGQPSWEQEWFDFDPDC